MDELELKRAIEEEDVPKVRELLASGDPLPNSLDGSLTPLACATYAGNIETITILIEAGADVNGVHADGTGELFAAVHQPKLDVLRLLLDSGADPNLETSDGPALIGCVMNGSSLPECRVPSIPAIKMLLDYGANIECQDSEGGSPLMWAVCGFPEAIDVLLQRGADPNHAEIDGFTILMRSVLRDGTDNARKLIQAGANINAQRDGGVTALIFAIERENADAVKFFIEAGADLERADLEGYTPLSVAVDVGNAELVKILLDAGADTKVLVDDMTLENIIDDVGFDNADELKRLLKS